MEAFMTIEELHRTVVDGFGNIEKRFNGVDERFARMTKGSLTWTNDSLA